jgi:hypothetical protein
MSATLPDIQDKIKDIHYTKENIFYYYYYKKHAKLFPWPGIFAPSKKIAPCI